MEFWIRRQIFKLYHNPVVNSNKGKYLHNTHNTLPSVRFIYLYNASNALDIRRKKMVIAGSLIY